jgi:hypothetical protein
VFFITCIYKYKFTIKTNISKKNIIFIFYDYIYLIINAFKKQSEIILLKEMGLS